MNNPLFFCGKRKQLPFFSFHKEFEYGRQRLRLEETYPLDFGVGRGKSGPKYPFNGAISLLQKALAKKIKEFNIPRIVLDFHQDPSFFARLFGDQSTTKLVEHWQHHPSVPDNSVIFEKKYRVGDKVQIDAIADYNGARWGKVRAGPRPCQDTWVVLRTSTGQEMFTACDRPHPYNYTMHLPSAVVFSLPCSVVMSTPLAPDHVLQLQRWSSANPCSMINVRLEPSERVWFASRALALLLCLGKLFPAFRPAVQGFLPRILAFESYWDVIRGVFLHERQTSVMLTDLATSFQPCASPIESAATPPPPELEEPTSVDSRMRIFDTQSTSDCDDSQW